MFITRYNLFLFLVVFTLAFLYYFLFTETELQGRIRINQTISHVKSSVRYRYSYSITDQLLPEFVLNIVDKSRVPLNCFVLIRTADGAIGNRMFLFASAYGYARLHQCQLYVAPWILTDLRSVFTIALNETPVHIITNHSVANQSGLYQRYSACTLYDDLLRVPLNPNLTRYEMVGFYQAYGYFIKYRDEISYLFQFNQESIKLVVPLVEQLLKAVWNIGMDLGNFTSMNVTHRYLKNLLTRPRSPLIPVTWIGIHIRRGDFLTFFHLDTNLGYLHLSMNFYRRKYVNCRFLIASDDKDYVQTHLANNSDVFITPKTFFSGHDLAALALCEHTIVTAGSYGWWAGWLAGGDVIHDIHYPVPSQNCRREHYFPPWFVFPHNDSNSQWIQPIVHQ